MGRGQRKCHLRQKNDIYAKWNKEAKRYDKLFTLRRREEGTKEQIHRYPQFFEWR
jgi:hypothetical protein